MASAIVRYGEAMDPMKPAGSMTVSMVGLEGLAGPLGRPMGSRRSALMLAGAITLGLAILAAAETGLLTSSAKLAPDPLSGTWSCSLGGAPVGTLTANGLSYVLASNGAAWQRTGTLERITYGKYREEYLKVQSGPLRSELGATLGYHYHLANKPQALVFNIGPGSGIRCTRA